VFEEFFPEFFLKQRSCPACLQPKKMEDGGRHAMKAEKEVNSLAGAFYSLSAKPLCVNQWQLRSLC
jgi:hypothetical protein